MAPDARFVDVTYRGLRVATRARLTESAPGTGFVEVEAPLPVGTQIKLGGDTTEDARVTGVVEQEAGAKSPPGMRIVWGEEAAPAKPVAVAEAEAEARTETETETAAVARTETAAVAEPAAAGAESEAAAESESESAAESEAVSESVTASASDSTPPGEPGRRRRRRKPGRS